MTRTVLILGARSDIARATAHAFAAKGYSIWLAGRNVDELKSDCQDLQIRFGVQAAAYGVDALKIETHEAFAAELPGVPDIAVCAIGLMGDQSESEVTVAAMAKVMRSNFEGPASLLAIFANRMLARGSGTLVGISSVAGLRGRASNYVYGAAKAGFTAFLSGLRNRMAHNRTGVQVITVLPGFVRTKMTAGMALPAILTAEPEELGRAILNAVENSRDVIYVRPVWRFIMLIIRLIPEAIFKKMSI